MATKFKSFTDLFHNNLVSFKYSFFLWSVHRFLKITEISSMWRCFHFFLASSFCFKKQLWFSTSPWFNFNVYSSFFISERIRSWVLDQSFQFWLERILFFSESKFIKVSFILESLSTFLAQDLPFLAHFFHDLQSRHVWVLILNSLSCFSYENHVCGETLFRSCCFDFWKHLFWASDLAKSFHISFESWFIWKLASLYLFMQCLHI